MSDGWVTKPATWMPLIAVLFGYGLMGLVTGITMFSRLSMLETRGGPQMDEVLSRISGVEIRLKSLEGNATNVNTLVTTVAAMQSNVASVAHEIQNLAQQQLQAEQRSRADEDQLRQDLRRIQDSQDRILGQVGGALTGPSRH